MKEKAKQYVTEMLEKYPSYADEIQSLYGLFLDEIDDDCSSPENEYELMVSGIEEIIGIK